MGTMIYEEQSTNLVELATITSVSDSHIDQSSYPSTNNLTLTGTGFDNEGTYSARFYCSTNSSAQISCANDLTSCEERIAPSVTVMSFNSLLTEVDLTNCVGLVYAHLVWEGFLTTDLNSIPSIATIVSLTDTRDIQGLVAGQTQDITSLTRIAQALKCLVLCYVRVAASRRGEGGRGERQAPVLGQHGTLATTKLLYGLSGAVSSLLGT